MPIKRKERKSSRAKKLSRTEKSGSVKKTGRVHELLTFGTKTGTIAIDYGWCMAATNKSSDPSCGFACVKACRLYGRNILKIGNGKPVLAVNDPEEIVRRDNECLSCEYACSDKGTGCIRIDLPLPRLEEYRRKRDICGKPEPDGKRASLRSNGENATRQEEKVGTYGDYY